jgi:hypothetical protein
MTRLSDVLSQPYTQAHLYPQPSPAPKPSAQYQLAPARPQPTLKEFAHASSGIGSLISLAVALLGNDEQREVAFKCLALTLLIFEATKPVNVTPQIPPSTPVVATVINSAPMTLAEIAHLHQQSLEQQHSINSLTHDFGEVCRQLAVTQGELTLLREVLLGDSDADTDT